MSTRPFLRPHLLLAGALLSSALLPAEVSALSTFPPRLPSAASPSPCATCHVNPNGGGTRNAFGQAFDANGQVWSPALAALDSDNDGYSNGVELGDTTGTVTGNTSSLFVSLPGSASSTPCGNGALDALIGGVEQCDGANLDAQSCQSQGFASGTLSCKADCTFDTSACTTCGDGVVDAGEACDGAALDGKSCVSEGFASGTLACKADCTLDTSACEACGNGALDAGEQCDGAALAGADCQSRGFDSGTLSCDASCNFDTSQCVAAMPPTCGDMVRQGNEVCDGADLDLKDCQALGFASGTLACDATCAFDTSQCVSCGNGALDAGESCDGAELDGKSCITEGFAGGTLACDAACAFDTSACTTCGDGVVDAGEACDGAALDGKSCDSEGFASGTLACKADCTLDTTLCVMGMPMEDMGMVMDMGSDMSAMDMAMMPDMDTSPEDMGGVNDMGGIDMAMSAQDMATPGAGADMGMRDMETGDLSGSRGCCAVVEPESRTGAKGWLLALGLVGLGFWRRRKSRS